MNTKISRNPFVRAAVAGVISLLASCSDPSKKESSSGTGKSESGSGATTTKVLRFTAIPNQNTTELETKFKPLAEHLTKELGYAVEYVPSSDYKASVEMFRNGQVQLAWFGGVTGVQARDKIPGARAIVQGKEDTAFKSYFIVHKDVAVEKGADFPAGLSSLTFTFGSESSTSGRVMPEHFIKKATGKTAKEFFTAPVQFSGGHDKTLEQVANGSVQAGVLDYAVFEKLMGEGKFAPDAVKVVWETPTYHDYQFTIHPDVEKNLGSGSTDEIKATLIDITTKAPDLLKAFTRTALIPAQTEDYQPIEAVMIDLGMIRK